eukprot:CAMPEP_0185746520 /NCGR_PEP_ID=MMETSP1174-20130828/5106_1 /TAXON_ID=35687 /ORGANISM="Dictyocha speculum, Strain CCMP1381" /LENGTH=261 /DNA_ID=CAMNT_0028421269 /DNA_START=110 /DNA_END=898 /DNA_ORIENTATION=+
MWNTYLEIAPHLIGHYKDTNEAALPIHGRHSCNAEVILNATARGESEWFRGALNRCPSPWYSLREIYPEHVSWSPNKPSPDGSEEDSDDDQETLNGASPSTNNGAQEATKKPESGEAVKPQFLLFLLYLPREPFSAELEAVVEACAPAFPRIRFVKGEGSAFTSLVAQYSVRAFPRLLLFRDGLLISKYHGSRNTAELTAYLANQTNALPASRIRPLPRAPPANESHRPFFLQLSIAYVALRLLFWVYQQWYGKDHDTGKA